MGRGSRESHRAGHRTLLLNPIPEPDDGGSGLGVEGAAREVVGGARLQQDHRATVDLRVLWRDCGGEESKVSPGGWPRAPQCPPSPQAPGGTTSLQGLLPSPPLTIALCTPSAGMACPAPSITAPAETVSCSPSSCEFPDTHAPVSSSEDRAEPPLGRTVPPACPPLLSTLGARHCPGSSLLPAITHRVLPASSPSRHAAKTQPLPAPEPSVAASCQVPGPVQGSLSPAMSSLKSPFAFPGCSALSSEL